MGSRQVRRARERFDRAFNIKTYPRGRGGPSKALIHKNRKHRDDGKDYFKP